MSYLVTHISVPQYFININIYDVILSTPLNGTERNGTERNGTERNGTERRCTLEMSISMEFIIYYIEDDNRQWRRGYRKSYTLLNNNDYYFKRTSCA